MQIRLFVAAGLLGGCVSATTTPTPAQPESAATAPAHAAAPATSPAEITRVRNQLADQYISFEFRDARLADVAESIAKQTRVHIAIDPEVEADLRKHDRRITLAVDEESALTSLRRVLRSADLAWAVEGGGVVIRNHPPAVRRLLRLLDSKSVSPAFEDTPLRAVVRFFADVLGEPIDISPKVFAQTPEDSLRLTLKVDSISLRDALDLVLDMTNLIYTVEDGRLVVTTKS